MTSHPDNLFRATRHTMIAVATSLCLYAGLVQADTETYTFTADGLFSTNLDSFSLGVTNSGGVSRVDALYLDLPINADTPELFKLANDEETFNAMLSATSPTQLLIYDFTGATVASLTLHPDNKLDAELRFATYSFTNNPPATAAPEIDPASTISCLFLLTGGLAVLRGRRTAVLAPTDSMDQALSAESA